MHVEPGLLMFGGHAATSAGTRSAAVTPNRLTGLRLLTVTRAAIDSPAATGSGLAVTSIASGNASRTVTSASARASPPPVRSVARAGSTVPCVAASSTCSITSRTPEAPAATSPSVQVTTPSANAPPFETEIIVVPGGNCSSSVAPPRVATPRLPKVAA